MNGHFLTVEEIRKFREHLRAGEKSENTVRKYTRDVRAFSAVCSGAISKGTVIAYKQRLIDSGYAVRSVNSVLASLNSLFSFFGVAGLPRESFESAAAGLLRGGKGAYKSRI